MADVTARWPLAVVVSVAVHGALALGLLAVLGRAVAPAPKPAVEKATVVEVFRIGSLMPRAGKTSAAAAPAPPKPGAPSASPRVAPHPALVPGEAEQPAPQAVADQPEDALIGVPSIEGEGDGPPAAAPTSTSTTGGAGSGSGSGPAATADQAVVDPSIAAEVHARLARAASDCYPAQARRFRQQGQVPVSFCVEGAGTASKVVVTSSGAALLDEAARSCVMQRAEPFPAAAAGSCFSVKVEFGSAGVHVSR